MNFLRFALSFSLLAVATSSFAQTKGQVHRFCLGNYSDYELEWRLRHVPSRVSILEDSPLSEDRHWRCVRLKKPDAEYQLRVSVKNAKFSAPSCFISVKADTWVEVRNGSGDSLIACVARNGKDPDQTAKTAALAETEKIMVLGRVVFSSPVDGAKVQIFDRRGTPLSNEIAVTGNLGVFSLKAPRIPEDGARIEVTGGNDQTGPVPGKLAALILPSHDLEGSPLAINLVTTLLAEAADRRPNLDLEDLEDRLKIFLGIPETVDLGHSLNNPYQKLVNMDALVADARQDGSIEAFARNMVSAMERGENLAAKYQAPKPLPNGNEDSPVLKDPSDLAKKIAESILSKAGSEAFSEILGILGWKSESRQALDQLKQINARLDIIINELMSIATEVQKSAYDIRTDALNDTISKAKMKLETMALLNDQLTQKTRPESEILEEMRNLRNEIRDKFKESILEIHNRITGVAYTRGLLKVYAQVYLPRLVTAKYYSNLKEHLEYWQSAQTMIFGMLTAAYADPTMAEYQVIAKNFANYLATEKIQFPDNEPIVEYFGSDQLGESLAFQRGEFVYDRATQLLWTARKPICSNRLKDYYSVAAMVVGFQTANVDHYKSLGDAVAPWNNYYQVLEKNTVRLRDEQVWVYAGHYSEIPPYGTIPKTYITYFTAKDGPWKAQSKYEDNFYSDLSKRKPDEMCGHMVFHMPPGKYKFDPQKGFIRIQ